MAIALESERWVLRDHGEAQIDGLWGRSFPGGLWIQGSRHAALPPASLLEFLPGLDSLLWFQTSGTSAQAKWVALSQESFLLSARVVNAWLQAGDRDSWMLALPPHHVGGFAIFARAYLSGAGVSRLHGRWNPAALVREMDCCKSSLLSLVPTQLHDLVSGGQVAPETLRAVIVGGAALDSNLEHQARALGWPLLRSYGMTEACSQVATQALGQAGEMRVLGHWRVGLSDEGLIELDGPCLAKGCCRLVEGAWQWEALAGPWTTGDIGHLSESDSGQGLEVLGRRDQIFKVMGEWVALPRLQALWDQLARQRGFDSGEALLVDLPDRRAGRRLCLVSTLELPGSWVAEFNTQVSGYERISEVFRVPELPRTELGKVAWALLRDGLENLRKQEGEVG